MWANAQRDGLPAEYRWRSLFNAAKFGWRPLLECRAASCQDAKPVEIWRVPQTTGPISAASAPKFTISWRHVEEILLHKNFFLTVATCLRCEDIARQSCVTVPKWPILGAFLGPAFSASRAQHVSDLHSTSTLGPHHVSKCGRHRICGRWDQARKKKKKKTKIEDRR